MDEPLTFGEPGLLHFELRWEAKEPRGTAADATRGTLVVRLRDRAAWGASPEAPEGFSWTWVELLEHLARHWAYILVEEGDPLGLGVAPERLRARAEERWSATTEENRAFEEEQLWAYQQSHDLASAVAGAYPSSLWLTREGNRLRAACNGTIVTMPLKDARVWLTALGEAVASRLAGPAADARAVEAVEAWKQREALSPQRLAGIATNLPEDEVEVLEGVLPLASLAFNDVFRPDEYLAVARMAGAALPAEELSALFATMRAQPQVWTGLVDPVAEGVAALLSGKDDKPAYDQGRAAARWLREYLSLGDDARAEPHEVLAQWKVPVVDVRFSSPQLDAVSVWGPRHGPAVIVNRNGRHGRMNGRRATIAHEIAHLVMDRAGALPVAEVLGGRISNRVEMRARAFAAEFLLPERVAGSAVVSVATVRELEQVVRRLSAWYGASMEIVAWQAANAHDRKLPPMIMSYLRSKVSNPQAF